MVALEQYQKDAVEIIVPSILSLIDSAVADKERAAKTNTEGVSPRRRFLLQAPTGSGKTLMCAKVVEGTAQSEDHNNAYIFLAPNKLPTQARESFEQYLAGGSVSFLTTLPANRALAQNSIVFLNWSSINKKDNNLVKDREDGRNIETVIAKTKAEGRQIILVIDESHHTAGSANSRKLIDAIDPDLIFEITATPPASAIPSPSEIAANWAGYHKVERQAVVNSGSICKRADFNHNLDSHQRTLVAKIGSDNLTDDKLHIYAALAEREAFERKLAKESSPYIPLMGIQLPSEGKADKDTAAEVTKVDEVIAFLMEMGLDRKEIAVYLSGRQENLEGIAELHSDVKAVIFKTAIAVGWDCPRLKTGALLRDTKTKPFATQTLGRWTRQPLRKHLNNEYLNRAYFYTEVGLMPKVSEENEIDVVLSKTSSLRNDSLLADIVLPSRRRLPVEKVELDAAFAARNIVPSLRAAVDDDQAQPKAILSSFGFDNAENAALATVDAKAYYLEDTDDASTLFGESNVARLLSGREAENVFKKAVEEGISKAHKTLVSPTGVTDVAQSLLTFFGRGGGNLSASTIARIAASSSERYHFVKSVAYALAQRFMDKSPDRFITENFEDWAWYAPKNVEVGYDVDSEPEPTPVDSPYAYDLFPDLSSSPEKRYLEATSTTAYKGVYASVMKNGDKNEPNFAIEYDCPVASGTDETTPKLFYPDWIAVRKDGGVDLHETKAGSGVTDYVTLAKHKAAVKYCEAVGDSLGYPVSFAIVNVEERADGPRLMKAKPDAETLDPSKIENWEPLV